MTITSMLFYNLRNNFRWVFAERLRQSFNFANMRFAVKVIFFGTYFSLLNFTRTFTFMESLLQNFIISFFTLIYVPLNA